MKKINHYYPQLKENRAAALVLTVLLALLTSFQAANAATNYFRFYATTAGNYTGPDNPLVDAFVGATTISGAGLNVNDVVVFDGVDVSQAPGTSDQWGAINLNQGGYLGLTGAALAVKAEMAANTGNTSALFPAGTSFGDVGGNPNHVRIELTVTEAGSTTNMSYLAEVDPGFIGTFYSLSGTVTFANNTIALTFGANNDAQKFYDNSGFFAAAQPTPTNALGTVGNPITLTGNFEGSPDIPLAIQWFKNGNSIQDATNLIYTTPPLTIEDAGAQFTYVLTNLNTSATATSPETTVTLPNRTTPGIEVIDFNDTIVTDGNTAAPSPPVDISGAEMLAGDTWIFDAIIETNAPLTGSGDGWVALEFAPGGYIGVTSADLGVLVRVGIGAGQLFINGGGGPTTTSSGAILNRVRVELFPSAAGSTTNMGYLVQIDQNNSGTLRTVASGTNLTFPDNNIPLGFGADAVGTLITEDTESVSVFTGPTPTSQTVSVGTPVTVGVVVKGWYPAFQWLKNGNIIPNATNRYYTLASPTLTDDGDQFSVVVSNMVNPANVVTSGVATVTIRTPNNLTWNPIVDDTTWDTTTLNWTNISAGIQTHFTSGDNATLDSLGYDIGGTVVTAANAVNANTVTVNATDSETYQWTGSGSFNGQSLHLTGDGTGTLQSETGASFASATIDAGSTLQVGNGSANGSFNANVITNNGTIDFENPTGILTVPGTLMGSGSIYQLGTGQTTLSATNSVYSIGLISAGNLAIASAPVGNFENDAVLQPNGPANLLLTNSISGIGYIYFSGFQATTLTGSNSFTGQNQLFWSDVTVDNPWALGDTNIGSTIVSGGGRVGGLYFSNNVTWVQSLIIGGQSGAGATTPLLGNASGSNTVVGPLIFSSTEPGVSGTEFNIDSSAGILTIDSAIDNSTTTNSDLNLQGTAVGVWNGDLTDNGEDFLNVVKRGTGVWTLAGTNSYGGSNTVAGGTLLVTGQLNGSGAVLVESGGTLGGNGGTIAGSVTVSSGGTLAPGGTGSGTMTLQNSLTLQPGSVTSFEINKAAATNDKVVGLASVAYGGTLMVQNLSGTLAKNDAFPLFSSTIYTGGFANLSPNTPGAGLVWNTNTLLTDGTLRIAAASIPTIPTNITATLIAGNTLEVSWPLSYTGWTLQMQTNLLNANWVTVAGSTATNQLFVPITANSPSVFYRLVYP